MHLVEPFARTDTQEAFPFPEMPGYWQSVSDQAHGEWFLDPQWRPTASFPIRAGWTRAVLAGHSAVERRLDIGAPVLVMLSDRTRIQAEWSEELMRVDAVIDVEQTARRALGLGRARPSSVTRGPSTTSSYRAARCGRKRTATWSPGCIPIRADCLPVPRRPRHRRTGGHAGHRPRRRPTGSGGRRRARACP